MWLRILFVNWLVKSFIGNTSVSAVVMLVQALGRIFKYCISDVVEQGCMMYFVRGWKVSNYHFAKHITHKLLEFTLYTTFPKSAQ